MCVKTGIGLIRRVQLIPTTLGLMTKLSLPKIYFNSDDIRPTMVMTKVYNNVSHCRGVMDKSVIHFIG